MDNNIKRPAIRFTKRAVVYACLLIFSLIFTQALRAKASALLFWFLIILPIVSLVYVIIGKLILRIYVGSDVSKVEKMQPFEYELRIINPSPIAYPFIEAVLCVPENDGVRCTEQSLELSLAPLTNYIVKHTTSFKYRGNYEIGIRCLYISDFLGMFSLRIDVDIYENVLVFPRRLDMNLKRMTSATDIPNDSAYVVFSTEKAEIGNIREYIPGDSQKSIHWKLSSKSSSGTLMVKEFNTNTSRSVYMLCDFSRAIPEEVFEDKEAEAALKKALEEEEKSRKKNKTVKLKAAKTDRANKRAARAERLREKREKHGMSGHGMSDAAMIDSLIDKAEDAKKPVREKPERKPFFSKKRAQAEIADAVPDAAAAENERKKSEAIRKSSLAVGGRVKPEYARDMDEFSADGVVEMAIGAVLNELRNGNDVTLIWADRRQEGGVAAVQLTCPEDFDAVYPVFATAPICSDEDNVTTLLPLITESLNVTIRICTSNIDPLSLNRYAAIPGLFGGAGTGCVTEVFLFNPEERYEGVLLRREYVGMCRTRLLTEGVELTELEVRKSESGRYTLDVAAH